MRVTTLATIAIGTLLLAGGCPPEIFNNALPTTLEDINQIRGDSSLSTQEKRTQLGALGIAPLTINALLNSERLGNQYGGDLGTAYAKLIAPNLRSLTPDEVQIFGDEATAVIDDDTVLSIALTDAEALAITTFFDDNGLLTPDELEAYLDNTANTVPDTIPDDVLRGLFVDFDTDLLLPELP